MVNFIIIAALGILILILIVLLAPYIMKRLREKHNVGGDKVPQFDCTLVGKGNDATGLSADDIYDCVEAKKTDERSE